jgi:hypothetical protein
MKTFAEIKDGVIVNTSVWETETPQGAQFVDITEVPNAGVGWLYVNGEFIDPTPAPTTAPSSGDIPVTEV